MLLVTPSALGPTTVTVTASDGSGSVSDAFVVTVTDNLPPVVVDPPGDATLVLGDDPLVIDLAAAFTDPEGEELTYACQSSAPGIASVSDCAGGTLTVTPEATGAATITITVSDGSNNIEADFMVTVVLENPPPTVDSPIPDASLALGDAPLVVGPRHRLRRSQRRRADVRVLVECARRGVGGGLRGRHTDGDGRKRGPGHDHRDGERSRRGERVGCVRGDGDESAAGGRRARSPISRSSSAATPFAVDLDTVFVDPNGDALAFSFGVDAGTVQLALDGSVLLVTPSALGPTTVTVTASDGSGSVSDAFVVTVTDNLPPVAVDPPADATLVLGEAPLSLDISGVFEDPEGSSLTLSCSSSVPSVASVGDCSGGTLIVTAVGAGVATVTITASDAVNPGVSIGFTVTVVVDNRAPTVVNPLADTALRLEDAPLVLALASVFDDADEDALVYACSSSAPTVASVADCADGTLIVTPEAEGSATITVTASDPDGASAVDAFVVTVGSNAPPSINNPLADVSLALGDTPLVVDLDAVFADPEGDELTYTCQSSASTVASVSGCFDGTLTVTPEAEGTATITVTASDPESASTSDSFTVTVAGCAPASILAVTPSPLQPERGESVTITAMVAGGQGATLRYRQGGAESFVAMPMTQNGASFTATIPGATITERGVDYVVEARSACGSASQSDLFALRVRIPAGVTSPILPASAERGGYRLISVPLALEEDGAQAVLDDFGAANEGWLMLQLLPPGVTGDQRAAGTDDQWYRDDASAISVVPGSAYWLIVRNGGRFNTGAGTTVSGDESFGIDIRRGWNLVGSPFGHDVPLDRVRMESGAALQLQAYEGAWRNETAAMTPFQGYALYAEAEDRLVVEPSADAVRSSARAEAPQAEKDGRGWAVDITAEIGQARDDNNTALVAPGATAGRDPADWFEPPLVGEYVSVSFATPGNGSPPLTIDARPISEEGVTWPVSVQSNLQGRVALSFEGIASVPDDYVVWLVDEASASVRDLRRNPSYSVSSQGDGAPVRMQLVIGTPGYAQAASGFDSATPLDYALAPSYPNPFRSVATIQYALPSAEHVVMEVFDIVGRRVALLVDEEMEAGYHSVVWDGRGAAGADLASGVYLYRLRAGSFTATQRAVLVR